jgi:hypothetical protein
VEGEGGYVCRWDRSDGRSAQDLMSNKLTSQPDLPRTPKLKNDGTWRGDQRRPDRKEKTERQGDGRVYLS